MPLREALAASLSRLCQGEASIAAVCRATRINRQQFNRYLAGRALPNQRNLAKICRHFNIEETDLFTTDVPQSPAPGCTSRPPSFDIQIKSALKQLICEERVSIDPGLYFAHFTIPEQPNSLMRSTLVIRDDGNFLTFRRLTGHSEPKGSWWSQFNGDHGGVILERAHWLYFIGLNRGGAREPTLLILRWVPISKPMLGGQALITATSGPCVTSVVLTPCPCGTTLREAIKTSHAYSTDDPEIDYMIVDALDQQSRARATMTQLLEFAVKTSSKPGKSPAIPTLGDVQSPAGR